MVDKSEKTKKPIALWAVPRSISTAFERYFVERDDFEVLHEPFGQSYYYSEDRLSERYADEVEPGNGYGAVLEEVVRPRRKRVFIKDMAYHARSLIESEGEGFAGRFINTFIVRDPKYVITSMAKMWPDFTQEEAGYDDVYKLFRLSGSLGQDAVVVDAMSFTENPEGVMKRYCEKVGVEFEKGSLSWEAKKVQEWESWDGWHDAAEKSTGIKPATRKDPVLSVELLEIYERCLPAYYKLAASAIPASR
ncbi:sulfotransferase family protein [Rubrobacter indicoceani]|uniref:sulfotransferase-like domain-containing protein n=1 Tax=Rubrobacter indicoceani TaxID=2051957 RepID=UPI000E5BC1C4|nr:sulfotransferase family protein [Rubrobacter indicoceani]